MACSIASEAMEEAARYAVERKAFGKPISAFQLIRAKFADHWAWCEAARTLAYKAAWMIEKGIPCREQCMLAKMFATEMCQQAVDEGCRVLGGNSFSMDYPLQRHFRDARFLLFGGGCHEVLRNALGSAFLRFVERHGHSPAK